MRILFRLLVAEPSHTMPRLLTRHKPQRSVWSRSRWLLASAFFSVTTAFAQTTDSPSAQDTVLVVGDSLSAEYGLERGTGWVELLTARMAEQYPNYRVQNASISGDTTSGGVARLPALLDQHTPEIVIIELGANDALRGLSLAMTENNLRMMTQRAQQSGAKVVLVGMQIPPNYGRDYTQRFTNIFPTVATSENAYLSPFLMEGIATDPEKFQTDGIHPNESAQPELLKNVWAALRPILETPAEQKTR